ncbi:hypothetical protein [Poriferisphaera sp. WC338]|uniref:hypothetical protein n=1 Tax=Poriferisphaera sp. WC338 TaxID=3425129 RepID=UPI003D818ED5
MNKQTNTTTDQVKERMFSPRRSYITRVIYGTLGATGARIGIIWLAIITLFAVLAPFIANSFPFIIKHTDGHTTFPLFKHLSPTDVALPIIAFTTLILFFLKKFLQRNVGWPTLSPSRLPSLSATPSSSLRSLLFTKPLGN